MVKRTRPHVFDAAIVVAMVSACFFASLWLTQNWHSRLSFLGVIAVVVSGFYVTLRLTELRRSVADRGHGPGL